jgi:hypothetical protein
MPWGDLEKKIAELKAVLSNKEESSEFNPFKELTATESKSLFSQHKL